jgi:hypothetical protein
LLARYRNKQIPCIINIFQGDGNIRYFELDNAQPYAFFLSEYKTATPQRGVGWLPKRGVTVGECEIGRCYKLTPKGSVEIVSFIVPRKVTALNSITPLRCQSTMFQDDIFPPTKEDKVLLPGARWFAGENGVPAKFSLKVLHTSTITLTLLGWLCCPLPC